MKKKLGITTANALLEIIKQSGRHCEILTTDAGTEFVSKEMKQMVLEPYKIHHHIALPPVKAGPAEELVKLLKRKIYRYMTYSGSKKWLDKLPDFTTSLNNRHIKALGMSPSEVNGSNVLEVFNRIYKRNAGKVSKRLDSFRKGDLVRIALQKGPFGKYYHENFSRELYTIDKVKRGNPTRYKLIDAIQTPLVGFFYTEQLQKVLE